jgi:hypothetical protein
LSLNITRGLYDELVGLPLLGQAPPGTATVELDNYDQRFTPGAGGAIVPATGIFRIPIRITMGYYLANGVDVEGIRQFTGEIELSPLSHTADARTVTLSCIDVALDITQRKWSSQVYEDQRADQLIATLLNQSDLGSRSLDYGISVFPYAYLDDENIYEEIQKIARADSGWFYMDENGQCCYERATHWLEGAYHTASQATLAQGLAWSLDRNVTWRDCYTGVIVEYAPRYVGLETEVYQATETIVVPPSSTIEHIARFNSPVYSIITPVAWVAGMAGLWDYQAVNAAGGNMASSVSIAALVPDSNLFAQRAELSITNAHASNTAYVMFLKLRGYPLVGDEAVEDTAYATDAVLGTYWPGSTLAIQRKQKTYPVRGGFFIQTHAAAHRLASWLRDILQMPRNIIMWSGAACPWLQLGDRVTVSVPTAGNVAGYVAAIEQSYQAESVYEMKLKIIPVTDLFARASYFIIGVDSWATPTSDYAFY